MTEITTAEAIAQGLQTAAEYLEADGRGRKDEIASLLRDAGRRKRDGVLTGTLFIEFTAEQLGQLTDEQLDAVQHCRLCLEPYRKCGCREGVARRKPKEPA